MGGWERSKKRVVGRVLPFHHHKRKTYPSPISSPSFRITAAAAAATGCFVPLSVRLLKAPVVVDGVVWVARGNWMSERHAREFRRGSHVRGVAALVATRRLPDDR